MQVTLPTGTGLYSDPQVILPTGYPANGGNPLAVYVHGASEDKTAPLTRPGKPVLIEAMSDAGWIVASIDARGENWGNAASVGDYLALLAWLRANYSLTGVEVLVAQSMGGLDGFSVMAQEQSIAGLVGWFPVCSLAQMFPGTYHGDISTAYGLANDGEYAAKTAGFDPMRLAPSLFAGRRYFFSASPEDTIVPKSFHSDAMRAKIAPYAAEATLFTSAGEHGAEFPTVGQTLAFLERCKTKGQTMPVTAYDQTGEISILAAKTSSTPEAVAYSEAIAAPAVPQATISQVITDLLAQFPVALKAVIDLKNRRVFAASDTEGTALQTLATSGAGLKTLILAPDTGQTGTSLVWSEYGSTTLTDADGVAALATIEAAKPKMSVGSLVSKMIAAASVTEDWDVEKTLIIVDQVAKRVAIVRDTDGAGVTAVNGRTVNGDQVCIQFAEPPVAPEASKLPFEGGEV